MITREQALTADAFEHVTLKNADGTPKRCRRNGAAKTWKRNPEHFRIPVKRGLYEYGYIENRDFDNTADWVAAD